MNQQEIFLISGKNIFRLCLFQSFQILRTYINILCMSRTRLPYFDKLILKPQISILSDGILLKCIFLINYKKSTLSRGWGVFNALIGWFSILFCHHPATCQLSNLDQMPIVLLKVTARTYNFQDHITAFNKFT